MHEAVRQFASKVSRLSEPSTAMVYYAGHGMQLDGENFLIPTDARIARPTDLVAQALPLHDLMQALDALPSRTRIVILDACRNSPFAGNENDGRGLAIVDAPTGSIVAYATAPGTAADDGVGEHSPYTTALLEVIKEPALPIEQLFKKVRLRVHQLTDGRQTPWESSSLVSDFWFLPVSTTASAIERTAKTEDPSVSQSPPRSADEAYTAALADDSVAGYQRVLATYPTHPLMQRLRRPLARRLDALAWRDAVVENTPQAYARYLARQPDGQHVREARRLHRQPRLRAAAFLILPVRGADVSLRPVLARRPFLRRGQVRQARALVREQRQMARAERRARRQAMMNEGRKSHR
jgi:uncharacterized caspase-like protein